MFISMFTPETFFKSLKTDQQGNIFETYKILCILKFTLIAPEATMLCLVIIFDNIVDDIWWFAMLLRPIFAKIDKRG